jgi:hypothetical protein
MIEADRWGGVITKVLKDMVYIKFDAPIKGAARVIFDSKTEFVTVLAITLKVTVRSTTLRPVAILRQPACFGEERTARGTSALAFKTAEYVSASGDTIASEIWPGALSAGVFAVLIKGSFGNVRGTGHKH